MASVSFAVHCRATSPGQCVFIVGSTPELGNWCVEQGVKCSTTVETFPKWTSPEVTFPGPTSTFEFKLVIAQPEGSHVAHVLWEDGENRQLSVDGQVHVMADWSTKDFALELKPLEESQADGGKSDCPSIQQAAWNVETPGEENAASPAAATKVKDWSHPAGKKFEELELGVAVTGVIVNVSTFGVFADIGFEENVKLCVPRRSWRRFRHGDVVKDMDIISIDLTMRRVSVRVQDMVQSLKGSRAPFEELYEGKYVDGVVDSKNRYGIFVNIGAQFGQGRLSVPGFLANRLKRGQVLRDLCIVSIDEKKQVRLALDDLEPAIDAAEMVSAHFWMKASEVRTTDNGRLPCLLTRKEVPAEERNGSAVDEVSMDPKEIMKQQLKEKPKGLQGDFRTMPSTAWAKIHSMFQVIQIDQAALDTTFQSKVKGHAHGELTRNEQRRGDERPVAVFGQLDPSIWASCQKGFKGREDMSVNQDNFSVTHFKSGYTLVCVADGHGQFGHLVAARAVQSLPFFMVNGLGFDKEAIDESLIEEVLANAFEKANKDVELLPFAEWSGTTAVAALFKGNQVWTANLGDSRCVIGNEDGRRGRLTFETSVHKPHCEQEKNRIESMGGIVRIQNFDDGWTISRVHKENSPCGLSVARALGDHAMKGCGVIATPEVAKTEVDLSEKVFLLLATDGVWEFLRADFVVEATARCLQNASWLIGTHWNV